MDSARGFRTRKRSAAALLAIALVLAACGGGEEPETPTGSDTPSPAAPTGEPSPPPSASPSPSPAPPAAPAPAAAPPPAPAPPAPAPVPAPAPAPPAATGPQLTRVADFNQPLYLVSPPGDGRIFVVEKGGRIVQLAGGAPGPVFLDISGDVSTGSEQGLLSMAFAPDYAASGLFYVYYTNRAGDTRVEELRRDPADPNRADPGSRRLILAVDQPYSNHNGGLIGFDPGGMLMIGLGDGGNRGDPGNRAQDLSTLLGKLLRVDPRSPAGGLPYGIPAGNPFVGRPGARPEIWAYGLRNPWRWSFDAVTGDLYVADVGQNRVEEVSFAPPGLAGANYGWRRYEGNEVFDPGLPIDESRLVGPIFTYRNGPGACSVTGGGVYRGSVASLRGWYLFADFCGGVVRGLRVTGGVLAEERTFGDLRVGSLSSFGVDSAGEMYVLSLAGGVYRISG